MTAEEFKKRFKVGDKIMFPMDNMDPIEILFMGERQFFYRFINDLSLEENAYYTDNNWIPYTEPKKKKTVKMAQALLKDHLNNKISPLISGHFFANKKDAEKFALNFSNDLIQWPLVINGEEQWIEVEVEE